MLKLEFAGAYEGLLKYLRASAEATGRTVEEVALQAIANGVLMDRTGLLALSDRARDKQLAPAGEDSAEIIHRLRNAS
jgi:hypothetical protein